jgi:hypothetical protein
MSKKIRYLGFDAQVSEILTFRNTESTEYYRYSQKPPNPKGELYLVSIQILPNPIVIIARRVMMVVAYKQIIRGSENYEFSWVAIHDSTDKALGQILCKEVYPRLGLVMGDWVWMDLYPMHLDQDHGLNMREDILTNYTKSFVRQWNEILFPDGQFTYDLLRAGKRWPVIALLLCSQEYPSPSIESKRARDFAINKVKILIGLQRQQKYIYAYQMVRNVSSTEVLIIKAADPRLWRPSILREDIAATFLQAMSLQEAYQKDHGCGIGDL